MEPTTDRFKAEIRHSHHVESYIDVVAPNLKTYRLNATDGQVQVDRTASQRRRCTASCVDPTGTLTPTTADSVLTPFGTIVRPYRGVMYDDGTTEVIPLGIFQLSKVTVTDQVGGSPAISLDTYDLSRVISRQKFTSVYTIDTGINIVTAIKALINRTFPDVVFDSISTSVVTVAPLVYDVNADPWAAIMALGDTIGCEVFFGATGQAVIAPPADIDHLPAPAWTYIEGNGCTMTDLDVVYSDDPGYNGVVLIGESPGDALPAVRSVVWDDHPSSPTYHLGPYGEVPLIITDQTISTQADADAAATAILQGLLGFSSQLSLTAWVNPALDCNDTVQVERVRSGVTGLYAIDKLTIPLSAKGTQSIEVRAKRTV